MIRAPFALLPTKCMFICSFNCFMTLYPVLCKVIFTCFTLSDGRKFVNDMLERIWNGRVLFKLFQSSD
jgi:(2Fe-2S) ferredoxin